MTDSGPGFTNVPRQTNPQPTPPPSGRPTPLTPDAWAAQFQQRMGREPSMSEYQKAVADGIVGAPRDPSVQQMRDGMQQLAQGAGAFFDARVKPAMAQAGDRMKMSVTNGASGGGFVQSVPRVKGVSGLALVLPVAAVLTIIALFMPVVTVAGQSLGWFNSDGAISDGPIILILCLLALAASGLIFAKGKRWAYILSGVLGILAGIVAAIDGFGSVNKIKEQLGSIPMASEFAKVGFGPTLMGLMGLVMLVGAVLDFLLMRSVPSPTTPGGSPAMPPQTPGAPYGQPGAPSGQGPQQPLQ